MNKLSLLVLSVVFVLSIGLISANTLVGGKIYNSDFSEVISGADVSVQCGETILNTLSLNDGSYAVVFNTESCYRANDVLVNSFKGKLSGKENAIINELLEEKDLIAVANVNLKVSDEEVIIEPRGAGGTWFMCGNNVCDSGETYETCPTECPKPIEPNVEEPTDDNSNLEEIQDEQNLGEVNTKSLITGAVIGGNTNTGNLLALSGGFILLLIIGVIIAALIKGRKEIKIKSNQAQDIGIVESN